MINNDTLESAMEIEDPVMFTRAWNVTRTYRRLRPTPERPTPELEGAYCEIHRNPISENGQTATLPGD
jgi:hypothetical protein